MLRITTLEESGTKRIKVEGQIVGLWVKELEEFWKRLPPPSSNQKVVVDLTSVTFIDSSGKKLLRSMYERGAQLVACGCLTKFFVEEITGCGRYSKRTK
jgi:anti-anti-sigma regulatory factor